MNQQKWLKAIPREAAKSLVATVTELADEEVDEEVVAGYVHGFVVGVLNMSSSYRPFDQGSRDYHANYGAGWYDGFSFRVADSDDQGNSEDDDEEYDTDDALAMTDLDD